MYPYFTTENLLFLYSGALILIASVIFFHFGKRKTGLILLMAGTFVLGCFVALMNNYLSLWDEQFHAVVAKNMMYRPFKPMFINNPLLPYHYEGWAGNYIWLHKQPLFLWQMALSMRIFGVNIFGLRLPSILEHTIMCIFIYRIGKITINEKAGFYGALFFAVGHYPLEMVAGIYATDHNDVAFLFYFTATLWAWMEYWISGKRKWLILAGLFSGCAVLVKWLVGLMIYVIWGIILLLNKERRKKLRSYTDIILSFLLAVITFLPWQIYIFFMFPQEAKYEFLMNSRHFTKCVENQCGDFWFYFEKMNILYGSAEAMPYFILVCFLVYVIRIKSRDFKISITGIVLMIYLLFSLAQTKMISYTAIAMPIGFLSIGVFINFILDFLFRFLKIKILQRIIASCIVIVMAFLLINLDRIYHNQTLGKFKENWLYGCLTLEKETILQVKETLHEPNYIVFDDKNPLYGYASSMFFTDYTTYWSVPDQGTITFLQNKGYKIAVLDYGGLPDYIVNDASILKILVKHPRY